jgi:hypothetical protein
MTTAIIQINHGSVMKITHKEIGPRRGAEGDLSVDGANQFMFQGSP